MAKKPAAKAESKAPNPEVKIADVMPDTLVGKLAALGDEIREHELSRADEGSDTVPMPEIIEPHPLEPSIEPDPDDVFNGADPKLFDHDGDGHPGGGPKGGLPVKVSLKEPLPATSGEVTPSNPPLAINRMVHYYANAADGPYAAIVTGIGHTGAAHLTIFTLQGSKVVLDVPYVDELKEDAPAWRWPGFGYTSPPTLANIGTLPGATGDTVFGVHKNDLRKN